MGPSTTAGSRHTGAKEDDTAPGHNRAQAAGDDAERTAGSAARPAAALPSEAQGQLRQGSDAESGGRPGNVSANAAPRDGGEALRDERMPSDGPAQARCRRQTPLTTRTTLFRQKETPRGQRESGAAPAAPPETCVNRYMACQGLVGPAVYTINTRGRNTRASLGVPKARAPSSLHCAS